MCLKIDFQSHNQCLLYYLFGLLVVGALSLFWLAALWEMVGHFGNFSRKWPRASSNYYPARACAARGNAIGSGVSMYVCMYVCMCTKNFLNHTLAAISNRETMVEG